VASGVGVAVAVGSISDVTVTSGVDEGVAIRAGVRVAEGRAVGEDVGLAVGGAIVGDDVTLSLKTTMGRVAVGASAVRLPAAPSPPLIAALSAPRLSLPK